MSDSDDRNVSSAGTANDTLPWEHLQPKSDEDRLRRALFYCHSLFQYAKRTLELLINRADTEEFGAAVAAQVPSLTHWQLESAYKLLTCMAMHISALDNCGDEPPAWLLEFYSDVAQESDELFPTPGAYDVIQRHGSWKRDRMLRDVSNHVCEILQFTEDSAEFSAAVAESITDGKDYRAELLMFALSQPVDALRRHMEMFEG